MNKQRKSQTDLESDREIGVAIIAVNSAVTRGLRLDSAEYYTLRRNPWTGAGIATRPRSGTPNIFPFTAHLLSPVQFFFFDFLLSRKM